LSSLSKEENGKNYSRYYNAKIFLKILKNYKKDRSQMHWAGHDVKI